MSFLRKKSRPVVTRQQALACIPVRNNILSWHRLDSGLIQIEYFLVLKPLFQSILKRFTPQPDQRPTRKLELDEMGSQVWQMIDGTRSTAAIIRQFAELHGVTIQEAEQSITLFLRELGKRGLIALR